ncbi:STAS domain-containing protein [Bacillus tianshenii]|nr:STAS domain-containing protein [Bacillus tianshenii]
MSIKIETFAPEINITIKEVTEFKKDMEEFVSRRSDYYILHLKDVTYMNSAALGIIANSVLQVKNNHGKLVISGLQPPIKKIFNLVHFESFIDLFDEYEEALAYLNGVSETSK